MVYDLQRIKKDLARFRRAVETESPYAPLYVKLKVTWKCNLRCEMCRHWRTRAEPPLPTARMFALIDELADLGCRKLKLSGGEPLLHPEIVEIVRRAARRGILVSMTTNGTLLTPARAAALIDAGLRRVSVSIDAPEPALHDRIRSVEGAFAATVAGVRELARAGAALPISVNSVVGDLNYEMMPALADLAADLGAASLKLISLKEVEGGLKSMTPGQIADYNARIAPQVAERALARGLFANPNQAYPFGLVTGESTPAKKRPRALYDTLRCFAPFTHALVEHDGIVKACCMLRQEPVLGDLKQNSFTEIWRGDAFRALRRAAPLPLHPRCRFCRDFVKENQKIAKMLSGENGKDKAGIWRRLGAFIQWRNRTHS